MALKVDPLAVKLRDRMSCLLDRTPGVELVPYTPGVSPEGVCDLGSVIRSSPDVGRSECTGPITSCPSRRPMAAALTSSDAGEGFERAVRGALEESRTNLPGADPAHYRPLHLPPQWCVQFARPITLDGIPVRVVVTWDAGACGYRVAFDAHRPAAYSP